MQSVPKRYVCCNRNNSRCVIWKIDYYQTAREIDGLTLSSYYSELLSCQYDFSAVHQSNIRYCKTSFCPISGNSFASSLWNKTLQFLHLVVNSRWFSEPKISLTCKQALLGVEWDPKNRQFQFTNKWLCQSLSLASLCCRRTCFLGFRNQTLANFLNFSLETAVCRDISSFKKDLSFSLSILRRFLFHWLRWIGPHLVHVLATRK